jgi:hypothetical protein
MKVLWAFGVGCTAAIAFFVLMLVIAALLKYLRS